LVSATEAATHRTASRKASSSAGESKPCGAGRAHLLKYPRSRVPAPKSPGVLLLRHRPQIETRETKCLCRSWRDRALGYRAAAHVANDIPPPPNLGELALFGNHSSGYPYVIQNTLASERRQRICGFSECGGRLGATIGNRRVTRLRYMITHWCAGNNKGELGHLKCHPERLGWVR